MDPFLEEGQVRLRTRVRSWVERVLLGVRGGQSLFFRGTVPFLEAKDLYAEARELVRMLGQEDFIAHVAAKKFGGIRNAVQARDLCVIREELARGSSLADTMFAMQALGSYPITLAGNDRQKFRYLPPIARGEAIAAFALTEPQAGSDISGIETRAIKRGKNYRLSGVKRFISNAGLADTYVVFALTDPEKRAKGLSAFVVQADTPGLVLKERTSVLSPHPIGVIAFENCVIPQTQLLGQEEEGYRIALRTLDMLRCTVGAAAVGLAQRALEEAIRYSRDRRQFGKALADFQGIQFKLADMATELEASRLLVYQAAWAIDRLTKSAKSKDGRLSLSQKSSMAKLFATEAAQRVVDQALQIHGGSGVVVGSIMERLYRDVRALRIYEGTSEIQKIVIARSLVEVKRQK